MLTLGVAWLAASAQAGGRDGAARPAPDAAPGSAAFSALVPPALPPRPVRELRLAASPGGGLVLATLQDDRPAASWRGGFVARVLRVHAWKAGSWTALGGVLNYDQPRPLSNLDLHTDPQGTPTLVWNENYGDNDVIVFRAFQNGQDGQDGQNGAWTDWRTRYLGVSSPAAARTRAVAARSGEPVLIHGEYRRSPSGLQQTWLTFRQWDEAARTWTRSPPINDLTQFSRSPSMALGPDAEPTVAFLQGEVLDTSLLVKRWTGAAWQSVGGPLNRRGPTYLAAPRLALSAAGQPTVAWLEDLGGVDTLYVSRWNGEAWAPFGGALSPRPASEAVLVLDGQDRPVLAWVEEARGVGEVHVARWQGSAWTRFGVLNANPNRDARSPALTRLSSGQVVLAWREDVGGLYRVQLRALR